VWWLDTSVSEDGAASIFTVDSGISMAIRSVGIEHPRYMAQNPRLSRIPYLYLFNIFVILSENNSINSMS
jgi:hypothetical protein